MAIQENLPQAMEEVRNHRQREELHHFYRQNTDVHCCSPGKTIWDVTIENFLKHIAMVFCVKKCQWLHGKNTGASLILVHTHACTFTYTQKHIRTHIKTFLANEVLGCLLKQSVTLYVSLWWVCALQLHTQLEPYTVPHLCRGGFVESVFFLLCV